MYTLRATVSPRQTPLRTTDEVPSPSGEPTTSSSKRTLGNAARSGAGAMKGFPAIASHVRTGRSYNHPGSDPSRLLASRSSSSDRIDAMLEGSECSRLFASMNLRMPTSCPIHSGSAAS